MILKRSFFCSSSFFWLHWSFPLCLLLLFLARPWSCCSRWWNWSCFSGKERNIFSKTSSPTVNPARSSKMCQEDIMFIAVDITSLPCFCLITSSSDLPYLAKKKSHLKIFFRHMTKIVWWSGSGSGTYRNCTSVWDGKKEPHTKKVQLGSSLREGVNLLQRCQVKGGICTYFTEARRKEEGRGWIIHFFFEDATFFFMPDLLLLHLFLLPHLVKEISMLRSKKCYTTRISSMGERKEEEVFQCT